MKVVYIAGPYRGANAWAVEKNIRAAEQYALEVAYLGGVPLCPHTMYRYFQGTVGDAFWLAGTIELLRRADAALFIPGWRDSVGARQEHAAMMEWHREELIFDLDTALPIPIPTEGVFGPELLFHVAEDGKRFRAWLGHVGA